MVISSSVTVVPPFPHPFPFWLQRPGSYFPIELHRRQSHRSQPPTSGLSFTHPVVCWLWNQEYNWECKRPLTREEKSLLNGLYVLGFFPPWLGLNCRYQKEREWKEINCSNLAVLKSSRIFNRRQRRLSSFLPPPCLYFSLMGCLPLGYDCRAAGSSWQAIISITKNCITALFHTLALLQNILNLMCVLHTVEFHLELGRLKCAFWTPKAVKLQHNFT